LSLRPAVRPIPPFVPALYEATRTGCGPLETKHMRDFLFQLVDVVKFIHAKGLYHRNIKPENIFLAQNGSIKFGDFGLSTFESWTYKSSVGSGHHIAPE
jgi:serine/threonine protein kinase